MSLSDFEIVTTTAGAISIRNKIVNEIMHNPIGPWKESNSLYVDQSNLRDVLSNTDIHDPVILYDVGLGSATNAIAAIDAWHHLTTKRPLKVISFENNLSLLEFTILNASSFPHLESYTEILSDLLRDKYWVSSCGGIEWSLLDGDFNQRINSVEIQPDFVFFDPYSPTVNQDMWTVACFKSLRAKCFDAAVTKSTMLLTYSVSTPVRTALLLAGFCVGYGNPTGLKEATTIASTRLDQLKSPLGKDWFGRWSRSHKKLPYGSDPRQSLEIEAEIRCHPQFQN